MAKLRALTYPTFHPLLRPQAARRPVAIAVVGMDRQPFGLALGYDGPGAATLLSLCVEPSRRGSETASLLLDEFLRLAKERGSSRIMADVPLMRDSRPTSLVRTLHGKGWQESGHERFVGHFDVTRVARELRRRIPSAVSTFRLRPWQLGAVDPPWSPLSLRPSRYVPSAPDGRQFVRTASFGIHGGDESVRGWFLAHALGPGTLRMTSHWFHVADGEAPNPFVLWRAYLERIEGQGWRKLTFSTSEAHPRFLRFCLRRLAPHAGWWNRYRGMMIGVDDGY